MSTACLPPQEALSKPSTGLSVPPVAVQRGGHHALQASSKSDGPLCSEILFRAPSPSHHRRMTARMFRSPLACRVGWILVEGGGGHGGLKKKLLPKLTTGSKTDPIKVFPHALAPQEVTRPDAWMQDV